MTEVPRPSSAQWDEGGAEAPLRPHPGVTAALTRAILLAAGIVVLLWFLLRVRTVLLFFGLALVLAISLNAPVTLLERRGLPRALATVVATLAALGIGALLGWMVLPPLVRQAGALAGSLPDIAAGLQARTAALLASYPQLAERLQGEAGGQVVTWALGLVKGVWAYSFSLVEVLLLGILLVSVVAYMVADPRPLLAGYVSAMPPHRRDAATRAFTRAAQATVGWMKSNVVLGTMKAVPAFVFLYLMGIPGALVWSVLAFFSILIPLLGFYVMTIPPALVALSISPAAAAWTVLFFWVLSEGLGSLVAPHVQGSTMRVHPVVLLFVTMAMGVAFGLVGVLIAAPAAGFLKAYYDEFYLSRHPPDPDLARRVDAMLGREPRPDGR